jgi:hypothetical protein
MKHRITAALLSLCLSLCVLLGGCNININVGESSSDHPLQTLSDLASDIKSGLKELEISENTTAAPKTTAPKATSAQETSSEKATKAQKQTYTMADIRALKNTKNFAKKTLEHIFDGTINGKGNATGYHYNQVTDSKGEIITGTESKKDSRGVFTAKVKVSGKKKNGFSTFYPEEWTPQQVVDAINEAYAYALNDKSNPHGSLWIGYSGDLEIDMYLDSNKKITTAYPIYEGD